MSLGLNLVSIAIQVIVGIIVLAPVLWIAGRLLVGAQKAKFTDAVLIVALGVLLGAAMGSIFSGFIGALVSLVIWLGLVKHFFDCGWGMALLIAVVALVVFVILAFILTIVGILALGAILGGLL